MVRQDRRGSQGGGLLFFIHQSIQFQQLTTTTTTDKTLERQSILIRLDNDNLVITNVYLPPTSSCPGGYQPDFDRLLSTPTATGTPTAASQLILGDFNAHHDLWCSTTTDARGNMLADAINNSDFGVLNQDTPTRVPANAAANSPDVSLASGTLVMSSTWHARTALSSDHLPIVIRLHVTATPMPTSKRTFVNLRKANWPAYRAEIEDKVRQLPPPADCHSGEKIFSAILRKAAGHHIPTGRHKVHSTPASAEVLRLISERDALRSANPLSDQLQVLNNNISRTIAAEKEEQWRTFIESVDHRTDSAKLWRTIRAVDGRTPPVSENESIYFSGAAVSSPAEIARRFNSQYNTPRTGPHQTSRRAREITHQLRKQKLDDAPTYSANDVIRAIKSCNNSKAFGPDGLSMFHLKHLGPAAIAYLTALFNDSTASCRIPAIWKASTIIPLPKPGKDLSQGASYRPVSLLCPAAKVLEALLLPTLNAHLPLANHQHGFRARHSTTSALLQLSTDIAEGFNEQKPPGRTVAVAVDLTAAFDTVDHNQLLSKILQSTLPAAVTRWLACYIRGRQARTKFRNVKSPAKVVRAGVPQGSKISPALFNYYLADIPTPAAPVRIVSYADDITAYATGSDIAASTAAINGYLAQLSTYLANNSLIVSTAKSTVTLFTPDPAQANLHPQVLLNSQLLPLERQPKLLGVTFDTYFAFHHHAKRVANKVNKRNNVLKALAGTSWGQQKETLRMTFKAIGRSVIDYAAPVWRPNASSTSVKNLQTCQNSALRVVTGAHKMASEDHLHEECSMLKVEEHLDLLSTQYLASCHNPQHPCHNITNRPAKPRLKKQTLVSKFRDKVQPALVPNDTKSSLKAVHTAAVADALNSRGNNVLLGGRPPPVAAEEKQLPRRHRTTLCQMRSGYCRLLNSYKHRLDGRVADECPDCHQTPQDVRHLFSCPRHPTQLTVKDLWERPATAITELRYLDPALDE